MTRHVRLLLVTLLVAFGAATIGEAAPKKIIRHRLRHSTRVTAGAPAAPAASARAGALRVKRAQKKTREAARRSTAKNSTVRSRASASRRSTTKPQ